MRYCIRENTSLSYKLPRELRVKRRISGVTLSITYVKYICELNIRCYIINSYSVKANSFITGYLADEVVG